MDIKPPHLKDDPDTGETCVCIPLAFLEWFAYNLSTSIVAALIIYLLG